MSLGDVLHIIVRKKPPNPTPPHPREALPVAAAHVDDLIVGVSETSTIAQEAFARVQGFWQWGEWEHDHFIQTGLEICQLKDDTISISFEKAAKKVEMIQGFGVTRRSSREELLYKCRHHKE